MCGILGQFNYDIELESQIDLKAGLNSIVHRGPDNLSIYHHKNASLGHVRLSIIDVSSNANQPFFSVDKKHALAFNGEIFNYLDLRTELEQLGHFFVTKSDTEVLLKLIIEFGIDSLKKLNGFYAISYVNFESNSGFIARDEVGIKPLFYCTSNNGIVFSSSAKAINISIPEFDAQLDQESIGQYLRFNYIPANRSIYKSIKKLRPGEFICFGSNGIEKHGSNKSQLDRLARTKETPEKEIVALLEDSIRLRLQSDVPVGCFLSGGIDSSIIASIAAQQNPNFKTFSIGFPESKIFDESNDAELLAEHLKTEHKTIQITEGDLIRSIDAIITSLDEPFADSSSIAVFNLCKAVKEDVTVALSGDGADELFGGYNKHKALYLSMYPNYKTKALKMVSPFLADKGNRESKWNNKIRQISKFNAGLNLKPGDRYLRWASFCETDQIQKLVSNTSSNFTPELKSSWNNNFKDYLRMDQELVLANDMLAKVDQMSMANSLEVRVPFLDTRIVDFARRLPNKYLHDGKKGKLILRKAFKDQLPNSIFQRPKHGFEVPLKRWLSGPLKEEIDNYLSPQIVNEIGIFESNEVNKILKNSRSTNSSDSIYQVWAIYVMHKWIELND